MCFSAGCLSFNKSSPVHANLENPFGISCAVSPGDKFNTMVYIYGHELWSWWVKYLPKSCLSGIRLHSTTFAYGYRAEQQFISNSIFSRLQHPHKWRRLFSVTSLTETYTTWKWDTSEVNVEQMFALGFSRSLCQTLTKHSTPQLQLLEKVVCTGMNLTVSKCDII